MMSKFHYSEKCDFIKSNVKLTITGRAVADILEFIQPVLLDGKEFKLSLGTKMTSIKAGLT